MATATPGIIINSLHGRLGNVVFYIRRGTQCVRTHVIPRNPNTEAQKAVRRNFADAVHSWQSLSSDEKSDFDRKARYMNMSGYNLYISKYINTRISYLRTSDPASLSGSGALLSISFNSFPSVSKPYTKGSGTITLPGHQKPRPG